MLQLVSPPTLTLLPQKWLVVKTLLIPGLTFTPPVMRQVALSSPKLVNGVKRMLVVNEPVMIVELAEDFEVK